jgi:AmpD protein
MKLAMDQIEGNPQNHGCEVDVDSGLLKGVSFIESPNHDQRPDATQPALIVIHGISLPPNQFGGAGITQLFTNQLNPDEHPYYQSIHQLKVSAHALIRRDGAIIQYVPFNKRAWHAGVSEYCGREKCNDFSIGIELEGADDIPYTYDQYRALSELIKALWQAYPSIAKSDLVGHSDIAPGRKTDPGESFDWSLLKAKLT